MKKAPSSKIILLTFTISILVLVFYSILPDTSGLQNEMVEGYLYKLILETTSDWTTMEILGGPLIVGYNYTITQGLDTPDLRYTISPNFIWIGKKALDTTPVRIDVEVIALRGGDARIVIKKGDVGSTKISIQVWGDRGYSQIYSIVNEGTNPQYPGTNDRIFYINLEQLYKQPITSIVYQPTPKEFEKCVLAFYYPWYGTPHGPSRIRFHWEGVYEDSIANAAHYPLLGVYDSQDERLIEAHILLAKSSGIDGFIVSWWGVNSFEDRSLEKIIKIAEKHDFKITIYYESYRLWNPPSMKQIIDELSYIVVKYSKSPAFMKVDGKSVIFIYAVESHERRPEFWLRIRRSLEEKVGSTYLVGDNRSPNYLHVFDRFHTYIELSREVMKNLYIFYNASMRVGLAGQDFKESVEALKSGAPITVQEKTLFYTVTPGYDDRKIRPPGNYLDRMNGEAVTVTAVVIPTPPTISEKHIVAHVGENLRLGNYQVSILSVKEAEYVKLGENYYKPREGMKFLILRVNVLNVEEHVEMCPCWGILPTEWCPFGQPVLITDKGWAYDWESLPGEWIPPEHVTEEVKKNAVECSIFPAGKSLAPNTYCEGDIFFESPLNENPVKIVFEPLPHYTVEIIIHSA